MRITFVLGSLILAGGYRAVFECGNRLIDRGHDVHYVYPLQPLSMVYAPGKNTWNKTKLFIKNCISRNSVDWFNVKGTLHNVISLAPSMIKIVENKIPDADVVIATAWETAYAVSRLSRSKGEKCYFVQHYEIWELWNSSECWHEVESIDDPYMTCISMTDLTPVNPELQRNKKLVDETYTLPVKKIATSSWLGELLRRKFNQDVAGLVPIGNNFDTFSITSFQEKSNKKKKVLLSYHGKPWKGDFDGLKAIEMVKEKIQNIDILIYGQVKDSIFPPWIELHHFPSDEELKNLYCLADIFIFPSWVEGWGSPPMEAMACGTACITTNVGGVPDYTIPGETAIVVPPRDVKHLANALITLLEDDTMRNQIAMSGYEYIKQFNWDRTVEKFEGILEEIIN